MHTHGQQVPLREPQGSILPHILLILFQIAILSGPPFPHRRELTIGAILGLSAACHASSFTQNLALANLFALAWPHYLHTLATFASAQDPERDLWRRDDGPRSKAGEFSAFSWRKIRWALAMLINLRGVGWSYEVAHLPTRNLRPSRGREGRVRFLLLQLVDLGWMLAMADLVSQLGRRLFFVHPETGLLYADTKHLSIRSHDLLWSLARSFVYGAGPYFFINMQYVACSIVGVVLGFSKPEDWPPLFGQLSKAVTVRSFWNTFWHQMIRKGLSSFSTGFARSFGLKRGTTLYSYTHLWTAFMISGVMHAASMLILPSPSNLSLGDRTLGIFYFFLWQAAAVTLEDFFQWCYRGPKLGGWASILGYAWVVGSFWFSLPLAGDTMLRLRMGEDVPLPFSMFQSLVQKVPIVL